MSIKYRLCGQQINVLGQTSMGFLQALRALGPRRLHIKQYYNDIIYYSLFNSKSINDRASNFIS